VTTTGSQRPRLAIVLGGILSLGNSSRGLEADSEVDIFAVGDTSLNTTTPVGGSTHSTIAPADEGVVVLASRNFCASETGTDLEALGSGDGEHGMGELRLELVEDRFTETGWDVANNAGDSTADGVLGILGTKDALDHTLGSLFVGASRYELVHFLSGDRVEQLDELRAQRLFNRIIVVAGDLGRRGDGRREVDFADGRDEGDDFDAVSELEVFLGDGTGGDSADRFASGAASTPAASLDAVFLEVGPISVARTRVQVGLQRRDWRVRQQDMCDFLPRNSLWDAGPRS